LDPRLGASTPWQVEDPAYGAAPPLEPQPWDTAAGSEQWSANWPFEETTQSWEANDESWRWPTQEVPTSTGSWDVDSSAWREEPWESGRGQPRGETGDQGYGYPRQSAAPEAPGGSTANGYPAAYDAPVPNGYPAADAFAAANGFPAANGYPGLEDLSAYGGTDPGASTGPMAPGPLDAGAAASAYGSPGLGARDIAPPASEAWTADAQRAWYGEDAPRAYESPSSEFAGVLESDEEQVVRLGRSADDPNGRRLGPMDGSRVHPARSTRTAEARRFEPADGHRPARSSWPRVVALISWVVLLMVVCWFYVFPWLEQILPENF